LQRLLERLLDHAAEDGAVEEVGQVHAARLADLCGEVGEGLVRQEVGDALADALHEGDAELVRARGHVELVAAARVARGDQLAKAVVALLHDLVQAPPPLLDGDGRGGERLKRCLGTARLSAQLAAEPRERRVEVARLQRLQLADEGAAVRRKGRAE